MEEREDAMRKLPTPNQTKLINYSDYDLIYWYCIFLIDKHEIHCLNMDADYQLRITSFYLVKFTLTTHYFD
jgi:hypothetical protein